MGHAGRLLVKEQLLTIEEAYMAMFYFLQIDYSRSPSDEIGGLLGSLGWSLKEDRSPTDPGAWEDWLDAVRASMGNSEEGIKDMSATYTDLKR